MYLIAIAWGYVALMMALVEATSSQGSILGALITLLLYGILPISILMYCMATPHRKAARKRKEEQEARLAAESSQTSGQTNSGDHAPADPHPSVGKEA